MMTSGAPNPHPYANKTWGSLRRPRSLHPSYHVRRRPA